ncbi:MAG: Ribosome maturation factor RimM [Anaerolineales bacterium]|nr:Ribosome maturation factor RimM [Anaerolineales bacterium]
MARKTSPANAGSGSPTGESVFLIVGFIRRPHGLRGEMIMDIHTDFPERLKPGTKVYIGEQHRPMTIATTRPHATGMLVGLHGLTTPDLAGPLRNTYVYVSAKDRPPLPEGQLYHHQVLGMRVVTDEGRELGKLTDIIATGANDVYVVTGEDGKEVLLPAIKDVILEYDVPNGEIRVHLLDGLIE